VRKLNIETHWVTDERRDVSNTKVWKHHASAQNKTVIVTVVNIHPNWFSEIIVRP
jgi:hypothetical protein